ncbi:MAG TPA: phage tailspike protein [Phnomibacter sp.]|nr:phage tailspike protein [Phnomibacter sp.]
MSGGIKIDPTHNPFVLPCRFGAVEYGKIYIGYLNTDPTVSTNQIPVYMIDNKGYAIKVTQPLRTNEAGMLVYVNTPMNFYTYGRYTSLVRNENNEPLYLDTLDYTNFGYPMQFDFYTGGTITAADQVIFDPKIKDGAETGTNHYWAWSGALPKTVPIMSSPYDADQGVGAGKWQRVALTGGVGAGADDDDDDELLRAQLASAAGAGMVGTTTGGKTVQTRLTEIQSSLTSHTHTAAQVGAAPAVHTHTAGEVGAVGITGSTMTGLLTVPNIKIINAPTLPEHGTNKAYVDATVTTAINEAIAAITAALAQGNAADNGTDKENQ